MAISRKTPKVTMVNSPRTNKSTASANKPSPVKKGPFGRPVTSDKTQKATAAPKSRRQPPILFKAPKDFRPILVMLDFVTSKDGFLGYDPQATVILGNPDSARAKYYDLVEYDPKTAINLYSRFNMMLYAPNILRRFTPNLEYSVLIRVGLSRKDGTMRVSIKNVYRENKPHTGKIVLIQDKTDPEVRKIRRGAKFLAGAFSRCLLTGPVMKELDKEMRLKEREEAKQARRTEKEEGRKKVGASAKQRAAVRS